MNVSETVKNAYMSDSKRKEIRILFPDLHITVNTENTDSESMTLKEALSEGDSVEFVGCISSEFKITVRGLFDNVKNERIEAYISSDGTEEIPLFHGKVDGVTISADKSKKTLACYDSLYSMGNVDIASWYKGLEFPINIKNFRDSLFQYVGITQSEQVLANDEVIIDKQYSPNTLKALDVIKAICQINGVFGIINRQNVFEYRTPPKIEAAEVTETIQYQKSLVYQEYFVKPVDKLTIRQTEEAEGVSFGDGENNYIIQGNFFTLNLEEEVIAQMAQNIYQNIEGFYYRPFSSDNNGFPWIECGESIVSYQARDYESKTFAKSAYKTINFYILSRTISGIQNLRDKYRAEGDEFQRVFLTDLNSRVDTIIEQVQQMSGKLQDYSLNYVMFANNKKITVKDGSTTPIARINFLVTKPTQVLINMEILLDVETTTDGTTFNDLIATVKYYYDNVFIDSRQPMETYTDGKHVLKLFYIINVEDVLNHEWEVRMEAVGGNATIEIGQELIVISGQGLVESAWDGRLEIDEEIAAIPLGKPNGIAVNGIGENIITTMQVPIPIAITDIISTINLDKPNEVAVVGFTDEVLVDFEIIGG